MISRHFFSKICCFLLHSRISTRKQAESGAYPSFDVRPSGIWAIANLRRTRHSDRARAHIFNRARLSRLHVTREKVEDDMQKTLTLALPAVMLATIAAATGYHVIGTFKIGGEGGWDYLTVDSAAHRLYVSHATHVVVVDTEGGKVVGDIPD